MANENEFTVAGIATATLKRAKKMLHRDPEGCSMRKYITVAVEEKLDRDYPERVK